MAKRFTDSEKWSKRWIRELPPNMKLFWFYILDECDHAGIYEVDIKAARFRIGVRGLTREKILETFHRKIIPFKQDKWFIPKFIDFQYGELNESNRAHLSAIKILRKYNLYENGRGLLGAYDGPMDMDKEKIKDKKPDKVIKNGKQDQLKEIKDRKPIFEKDFPHLNIDFYYDNFVDYLDATGKKYKNYASAFRTCCRSEWYKDRPHSYKTESPKKKKETVVLSCPDFHVTMNGKKDSNIKCKECGEKLIFIGDI